MEETSRKQQNMEKEFERIRKEMYSPPNNYGINSRGLRRIFRVPEHRKGEVDENQH